MECDKLITLATPPLTVDEYTAMLNELATAPEGAAACLVLALLLTACDPEVGLRCIAIATHPSQLLGATLPKRLSRLVLSQLWRQPYLPHSYILGALRDTGYALPDPPYAVSTGTNPHSGDLESGTYKVFVACSGAASPRPVTLTLDRDRLWKAREWSSLLMGIREPEPTP